MSALVQTNLLVPLNKSFAERIAEWEDDPEACRETFERADIALQEGHGLSWKSKSSENRHNRVLTEFRRLTILDLKQKGQDEDFVFGEPVSDAMNDPIIFPRDPEELVERVGLCLGLAVMHVQPRRLAKSKISAGTLLQRRQAMRYWITKGRKAVERPDPAIWFQRTNEVLGKW